MNILSFIRKNGKSLDGLHEYILLLSPICFHCFFSNKKNQILKMLNSNIPVQNQDREIFMDVLRGFAILGIFIANLNSFTFYSANANLTGPCLVPELDHNMSFLQHMFIEGKFYTIFSFLFGWGIALQIKRGTANGIDVIPTVKRRLSFMLLLGLIHMMIWPGDIVFFYAVLAFVLLLLIKYSDRTLLVMSLVMVLLPIPLYAAKMHWSWVNVPSDLLYAIGQQIDHKLIGVTTESDYKKFVETAGWWEVFKSNISGIFYRFGYLVFVSRIFKVLGIFLIGYVVGRSDFYKNIVHNKKIIYWVIAFGFIVGLPANYFLAYYMSNFMNDYWTLKANGFYQTIAYAFGVAPLGFAYIGLFMLSFQTKIGNKMMAILTPVGKMAFSNYIMHSLIGNFVFLNAGLGFMGQVGPVYSTLFGILVFIIQIIFSTLWLRYFNFGPVEWIWRSATYKKWQPMMKYLSSQTRQYL
jgi:uncharacterized protein